MGVAVSIGFVADASQKVDPGDYGVDDSFYATCPLGVLSFFCVCETVVVLIANNASRESRWMTSPTRGLTRDKDMHAACCACA